MRKFSWKGNSKPRRDVPSKSLNMSLPLAYGQLLLLNKDLFGYPMVVNVSLQLKSAHVC